MGRQTRVKTGTGLLEGTDLVSASQCSLTVSGSRGEVVSVEGGVAEVHREDLAVDRITLTPS